MLYLVVAVSCLFIGFALGAFFGIMSEHQELRAKKKPLSTKKFKNLNQKDTPSIFFKN